MEYIYGLLKRSRYGQTDRQTDRDRPDVDAHLEPGTYFDGLMNSFGPDLIEILPAIASYRAGSSCTI